MRRIPVKAALAAALVLVSCSSAPKAPDVVLARRNEAARLVGLGAKAGREGNPAEAAELYAEAYRLSTAIADDEGRVAALDGLGGLYVRGAAPAADSAASSRLAVPADAAACVSLAKRIAADSGRAELSAFASVAEAEALLRAGGEAGAREAAAMAAAAEAALGKRPADKARALRALAEARKALADSAGALAALAEAADLDRRLKRFAEYAAARYLAASVHSKNGSYPAAREALQDALEADIRAENSAGIGADFRALGMVAEKTGDREAAARYYARARDVFAAARFPAEAEDAERRRAALE